MTVKTSYAPGTPIWTDVSVPDMDAAIAFYTGLFGWRVERGPEEFGGYSNFHLGDRKVCGILPLMAPGQPAAWTTYVCTDDADKTDALVQEAGGTVVAPPMDVADLGRMAVYVDAAGAFFGTWQPGTHLGAEVVDEENAYAWTDLTTRDEQTAQEFYGRVFGWTPRPSGDYTELQLAGTSVAGCMPMPPTMPAEVPPFWMPYFAAADPEAQAARVADLGGTVLVPVSDFPGGRFAVVQDPAGATFGLLSLKR